MNLESVSRLWVMMKREVWESPFAFKWTPVIIAGFVLLFTILALIIGARVDNEMVFTKDGIRQFAELAVDNRSLLLYGVAISISAIYTQVMFVVVVFYLAGSLYDDRRDRSILFWKSLPISDTMTVLSKILTAVVLAPVVYLAGTILIHLILLIIATGYSFLAGVNPFTAIWGPSNLLSMWTLLLFGSIVQGLWLLPLYAWILFCSSWAPRLPILIATLVPVLIGIFQQFWSFFSDFRFSTENLMITILERIGRGVVPANIQWEEIADGSNRIQRPAEEMLMSYGSVWESLMSVQMWIGIAIGVAFIVGSIWFRKRATDS
ncbi:MAG: hypothetical protein AAGH65_04960 [Pseudomonadota bacterium]